MFITLARLVATAAGAAALTTMDALYQPTRRRPSLAYVPVTPAGVQDPRRITKGW